MSTSRPRGDGCKEPLNVNSIYIYGSSPFYGSLMSHFLTQTIEVNCVVVERIDQILLSGNGKMNMVLWDCLGKSKEGCLLDFEIIGIKLLSDTLLALFNLSPDLRIEQEVIAYGTDGFFYEHDSWEVLERGIRSIVAGEVWIPMHILVDYMKRNSKANRTYEKRKERLNLTSKEIEVLKIAASGTQNDEIAEKLFISPHTVKTHLSNIYKKIDVKNRYQAILWTAENLQ